MLEAVKKLSHATIMLIQKKTQRVLHQEFRELKEKKPDLDTRSVVSDRQPVFYLDELVRSDRGPVPTEIIHFLCEKRDQHIRVNVLRYLYTYVCPF